MGPMFISIGGTMFLIPMLLMIGIVAVGSDIPSAILNIGGWSMALGMITSGIGGALTLLNQR